MFHREHGISDGNLSRISARYCNYYNDSPVYFVLYYNEVIKDD
ncbi:hypothetical protein CLOSYM_00220 [[Clostridium] symbiosum ATCC 14940]|uniref:HTH araC/xylS-type domain-containing protein n=1 Tax=[Clostridium] symbiosum ATCC 14940 TaxID=411472 RepID=A0ABC9U3K4_CLOSY|nr:hypothetical protein CLOSYM_00220 [[Clostridium] symbiosum ATCC 14940]